MGKNTIPVVAVRKDADMEQLHVDQTNKST
jgi:hypothetical protein